MCSLCEALVVGGSPRRLKSKKIRLAPFGRGFEVLNGSPFALGHEFGCHTSVALFRASASTHEDERTVQCTKLLESQFRVREFYVSPLVVYVAKGGDMLVTGAEASIEFLSRKSRFCGSGNVSDVYKGCVQFLYTRLNFVSVPLCVPKGVDEVHGEGGEGRERLS